ncbi:hypothetical protein MYX06_04795, partial [Patescibacteria group bacterium AH-259-L05]|nr:hypothetical protein [Patescibacteria group bacterium AH-259-L05]
MNNAQQGRIKSCRVKSLNPKGQKGSYLFKRLNLIGTTVFILSLLFAMYSLLFIIQPAIAFTPPSAAPPGDNVPRPFNIGPTAQYKTGKIGVGTASAVGNVELDVYGDVYATSNITGAKYWDYDDSTLTYYLDPASTNWGLYTAGSINAFGTTKANYFAGKIGIATATPVVTLDIRGTDAIQIPAGTSTQRGAFTPAAGMLRYNTTTGGFEGYTNVWGVIGGGGGGGGVEWRQEYTATANQTVFTITAGTYTTGSNEILVFYNGVLQKTGSSNDYVETNFETITFNTPRAVGKTIVIIKGSVSGGSAGGWSDDGTVIRLTTVEDTVGIGTTVAKEKLDLRGAFYLGNTTAPSTTTNRLYAEAGTLKWGDTVVGTGSGGSWLPSGNDLYYNTGNVGIGVTSPTGRLNVVTSGGATDLNLHAYRANTGQTTVRGHFARGTVTTPGVIVNGDLLFEMIAAGYDGAAFKDTAGIRYEVDGAPGLNDMPGRIKFLTTPDGSTTLTERMRITNAGNVGIGTTSPSAALEVKGDGKEIILGSDDFNIIRLAPRGTAGASADEGFIELLDGGTVVTSFNPGAAVSYIQGSFGIKDTGPDAFLEVSADGGTGTAVLMISSNDANDGDYLIVKGDGSVGIGTTSPATALHISAVDGLIIPVGTTGERTGTPVIGTIRYNSTTSQFEGYGAAWGSLGGVIDVDQDTYVSAEDSPGSDNDELKFLTLNVQRMIIDSAGNVGIGTTNPSSLLQLEATVPVITVNPRDFNSGLQINVINLDFPFSPLFRAQYAGTTRFYITRKGRVGIGQNAPDAHLEVSAAGGVDDLLMLSSSDAANGDRFIVKNSGNVGIGTTSPATALHISAVDGLIIPVGTTGERTGTPVIGTIRYNSSTSQFEGYGAAWGSLGGVIDVDQDTYVSAETSPGSDNDELKFLTLNVQRMIIDSAGNVGIGTPTPTAGLTVYNKTLQVGGSTAPTGGAGVEVMYTGSAGILSPYDRTNALYKQMNYDALIHRFVISGTEKMRIHSDGNVGIGATSPVEKLDVEGAVQLGTTSGTNTGTIRWTGTDFEGYDGSAWRSLTTGASGSWQQTFVCTANQTVFNLTAGTYTTDIDELLVFYNGVLQLPGSGKDYVETNSTTITLTNNCVANKKVVVISKHGLTKAPTAVSLAPSSADKDLLTNPSIHINDTGGGNLIQLQKSGVDKFVVDATGKVGVGVSSPSYTLDVAGTGKFTQPIIVGESTADIHASTQGYVKAAVEGTSGIGIWRSSGTDVLLSSAYNNVFIRGTTLTLNSDVTGAPSENIVFTVERGTSADAAIRWNETDDQWEYTNDGSTYYPLAGATAGWRQEFACTDTYPSDKRTFTLTEGTYTLGSNEILVFNNGVLQLPGSGKDYIETNTTTITLTNDCDANEEVVVMSKTGLTQAAKTVSLAPSSADADALVNPSIFINDTGGGNLIQLQKSGTDKFVVDNAGVVSVTTSLTSPFIIGGTGTTSDLSLQTTSGVGATGADMHFLLGNNGATEAMTILNSGKVGIGTTAPQVKLDIWGGDIYLNDATQANDKYAATVGYVKDVVLGGADVGTWTLNTTPTPDELYVRDTAWKVGIGTTSPSGLLHVEGSASYPLTVKSMDVDAADIFRLLADDDGVVLTASKDASDSAEMYLWTGAGAVGVKLDTAGDSYFNGGNVGIGNSNLETWHAFAAALQIGDEGSIGTYSGAGGDEIWMMQNAYLGAAGNYRYIAANQAAQYIQQGDGVHVFNVAGAGVAPDDVISWTTALKLYNDGNANFGGNVGIGTTSPTGNLNVHESSPSADQIVFNVSTNAGTRFMVDEDGDVTMGKTGPSPISSFAKTLIINSNEGRFVRIHASDGGTDPDFRITGESGAGEF